jgi:predicted PurR-regulated permease PerM
MTDTAAKADPRTSSPRVAIWILAIVATIWFLREARDLLIPIALGILVSYALEPVVAWLERHGVKRPLGAGLVMLSILAAAAAVVYAFRGDALAMIRALPQTIQHARESVLSWIGISPDALAGAKPAAQPSGSGLGPGTVLALGGHLVVVYFLVFFVLMSSPRFRQRLVEASSANAEKRKTTAVILDDINGQIQRYLLVLLVTALMVGAATWAVLAWLNVQHALLWGVLAGLLNSIPYFGPVIVCGGLFVVGLTQGGGMSQAWQMAGAALLITSLEGWLVTPALMGKVERMSALAVFVGLVVWIWLWGEWGTILAVPMLAVIKSVADHVDGLKRFGRLMSP